MSRLSQAIHNDIQAVQLLRDEIKLHAHLLGSDMKDKWHKLEEDFEHLNSRFKAAAHAGADAEAETEAALKMTAESLSDGYHRLREAIKQQR